MRKANKSTLSRELNWMSYRTKGAFLHGNGRVLPPPLNHLLEQYNSIRNDIIATVNDSEFRDIFYKANGVESDG